MNIRGSLTTTHLPEILQLVETSRKSGLLMIGHEKVTKHIYYNQGLIAGSVSNDPKEYFGQFLLHYGKLEETQLRRALEIHRQTRQRLGRVLVLNGIMNESEVVEMLLLRALEIIYDLFLWDQAEFEFHEGVPFPEDLIRIEIRTDAVITEGKRRVEQWRRYRVKIPSDRIVLVPGSNQNSSSAPKSADLPKILWCVSKKMTVGEICYHLHASPFHVYSRLFELLNAGILNVDREVSTAPLLPNLEGETAETTPFLLQLASTRLKEGCASEAYKVVLQVLEREPNNPEAQSLFLESERGIVQEILASGISLDAVPQLTVSMDSLPDCGLGPKEGFILSRVDSSWDLKSILSICPFRDSESLQIIKKLSDAKLISF